MSGPSSAWCAVAWRCSKVAGLHMVLTNPSEAMQAIYARVILLLVMCESITGVVRYGCKQAGRARLDDRGDEASIRHGHSQRHIHVLVVGDAVAVWGASCTHRRRVRDIEISGPALQP